LFEAHPRLPESDQEACFTELALQIPEYESGNFVGPTILCDVTTSIMLQVYIISEFEYSLSH